MNPNIMRSLLMGTRRKSIWERLLPREGSTWFGGQSAKLLDDFFYRSFDLLGVDCLIECGAHEASASSQVCSLGKRAIAIEANPLTFKKITKNSNASGVETLNVGLGATRGLLTFYVPSFNDMAGNATFQPKAGESYDHIEVDVCPLDDVVSSKVPKDESMALWIDVEGFQRDVLDGAIETLNRQNCVLIKIEVENIPFFEGQALSEEVNDRILSCGFTPVLADSEYAGQFNVVYVRQGLIDRIALDLTNSYEEFSSIRYSLLNAISHLGLFHFLRRSFVNAFKRTIVILFGQRNGHQILARLGSTSSKSLLEYMNKASPGHVSVRSP